MAKNHRKEKVLKRIETMASIKFERRHHPILGMGYGRRNPCTIYDGRRYSKKARETCLNWKELISSGAHKQVIGSIELGKELFGVRLRKCETPCRRDQIKCRFRVPRSAQPHDGRYTVHVYHAGKITRIITHLKSVRFEKILSFELGPWTSKLFLNFR